MNVEVAPFGVMADEEEILRGGSLESGHRRSLERPLVAPFLKLGGEGGDDGMRIKAIPNALLFGRRTGVLHLFHVEERERVTHDLGPWLVGVDFFHAEGLPLREMFGVLGFGERRVGGIPTVSDGARAVGIEERLDGRRQPRKAEFSLCLHRPRFILQVADPLDLVRSGNHGDRLVPILGQPGRVRFGLESETAFLVAQPIHSDGFLRHPVEFVDGLGPEPFCRDGDGIVEDRLTVFRDRFLKAELEFQTVQLSPLGRVEGDLRPGEAVELDGRLGRVAPVAGRRAGNHLGAGVVDPGDLEVRCATLECQISLRRFGREFPWRKQEIAILGGDLGGQSVRAELVGATPDFHLVSGNLDGRPGRDHGLLAAKFGAAPRGIGRLLEFRLLRGERRAVLGQRPGRELVSAGSKLAVAGEADHARRVLGGTLPEDRILPVLEDHRDRSDCIDLRKSGEVIVDFGQPHLRVAAGFDRDRLDSLQRDGLPEERLAVLLLHADFIGIESRGFRKHGVGKFESLAGRQANLRLLLGEGLGDLFIEDHHGGLGGTLGGSGMLFQDPRLQRERAVGLDVLDFTLDSQVGSQGRGNGEVHHRGLIAKDDGSEICERMPARDHGA